MAITQGQFNLRVVEILSHMKTEIGRIRAGSSLSNAAGINRMIQVLEHDTLIAWPQAERQDGSVTGGLV